MHPGISVSLYYVFFALMLFETNWAISKTGFHEIFRTKVRIPLVIALILLSLLPVLGALLPQMPLKNVCQRLGNIWLGFLISFQLLMLPILILWLLHSLIHFGYGFVRIWVSIAICGAFVFLAYGMFHAQQTRVTHWELQVDKKAGGVKHLRIGLIGDLHLGVNSSPALYQKMVDLLNEEKPDVIFVAGDFFTSTYEGVKHPEEYIEILRGLEAPEGVYAVYGNHDVEEDLFGGFPITPISRAFRSESMTKFIEDCGFRILYDELTEIADGAIQVVGRVDGEKAGDGTSNRLPPDELLEDADPEKPILILQHEPTGFEALKNAGADAAFCGHTHNGQIFPGNLIVPFFNENAYGYQNVGGLDTFVTSGIGYYGPPMRVGTDSEIMVIDVNFQ